MPKVKKIRSLNLPEPLGPPRPFAGHLYLYYEKASLFSSTSIPCTRSNKLPNVERQTTDISSFLCCFYQCLSVFLCYVFFLNYLQEIIMKSEPSAYKLHAQAGSTQIHYLVTCVCVRMRACMLPSFSPLIIVISL